MNYIKNKCLPAICFFIISTFVNSTFGADVWVTAYLSDMSAWQLNDGSAFPAKPATSLSDQKRGLMATGNQKNMLVVSFKNSAGGRITMANVGIEGFSIRFGNTTKPINFAPGGDLQSFYVIDLGGQEVNIAGLGNGELIELEIKQKVANQKTDILVSENSDGRRPCMYYFFKYKKVFTLYGISTANTAGFFLPTSMFSTNFKADKNGIPFAVMPVGFAWGGKFNFINKRMTNKFYLGFQILGNYTITPKNSATATDSKDINFAALSTGLLLDLNNYVSIGFNYGFDLSSNKQHPGPLFVVGFAPDLSNFFKGIKNTNN